MLEIATNFAVGQQAVDLTLHIGRFEWGACGAGLVDHRSLERIVRNACKRWCLLGRQRAATQQYQPHTGDGQALDDGGRNPAGAAGHHGHPIGLRCHGRRRVAVGGCGQGAKIQAVSRLITRLEGLIAAGDLGECPAGHGVIRCVGFEIHGTGNQAGIFLAQAVEQPVGGAGDGRGEGVLPITAESATQLA